MHVESTAKSKIGGLGSRVVATCAVSDAAFNNASKIGNSSFAAILLSRAGGTGLVGPAKTGPTSSTNLVVIIASINALSMNVVMIATISHYLP